MPEGYVGKQSTSAPSVSAERYFTGELSNEFELFCAYYLGLDRDGKYRKAGMNDVARRFSTEIPAVEKALNEFQMDKQRVKSSGFSLEFARLDVQCVPPGIDRVEVARTLFQELLDAGCGVGPVPKPAPLDRDNEPEPEVDGNAL